MVRKILMVILIVALLLELVLCAGAFFFPVYALQKFGVVYNKDTAFLGYLTGWFLLFVCLICSAAIWLLYNKKNYQLTCYLLGFWWIGIGAGIYFAFKKPDNLLLDSLKGLLIIIFTSISSKNK